MTISTMNRLFTQAADMNIGYDQNQRWTYLDRNAKKLVAGGETDCSALSLGIMWLAGYPVNIDGTAFTGNFAELTRAAGFTQISVSAWDSARLFAAVRGGDFLLGPGHVLYVLTSTEWVTADGDERGKATGGQGGDQTGEEVRVRGPYMRSRGWTHIIRPPDSGSGTISTLVMTEKWTHRVGSWAGMLNVRDAPPTPSGVLGAIKTTVASGARCVLLDEPGKQGIDKAWWRKVKFEGGTKGWVNVNYIEPI